MPDQGKYCTKCGKWNYYQEYFKDKKSKDGHRSDCKVCNKTLFKIRRAKNRNIYNLNRKPYLKKARVKARLAETKRWYYIFNQEKIKERDHQRYVANREKRLAQMKTAKQRKKLELQEEIA